MSKVRDLLDTIGNVILVGYDWRGGQGGQIAAGIHQRGTRRG